MDFIVDLLNQIRTESEASTTERIPGLGPPKLTPEEKKEFQRLAWTEWDEMSDQEHTRYRELLAKFGHSPEMIESDIKQKTRKKHKFLTVEILEALPDEELISAILDYADHQLNGRWDKEYEFITSLSPGFQAAYTTFRLQAEVNNGGFSQYFWNSSSQFGLEALEGFRLLGAKEHAEIVEQAIAVAMEQVPAYEKLKEREHPIKAYQEWDKVSNFDDLDSRFYGIEEDIDKLRDKYIREHPEEFIGPEEKVEIPERSAEE